MLLDMMHQDRRLLVTTDSVVTPVRNAITAFYSSSSSRYRQAKAVCIIHT